MDIQGVANIGDLMDSVGSTGEVVTQLQISILKETLDFEKQYATQILESGLGQNIDIKA